MHVLRGTGFRMTWLAADKQDSHGGVEICVAAFPAYHRDLSQQRGQPLVYAFIKCVTIPAVTEPKASNILHTMLCEINMQAFVRW